MCGVLLPTVQGVKRLRGPSRALLRGGRFGNEPAAGFLFEWLRLGGVSDGFDVDFRTLAGTGNCVLEAKSLDSWGSEGTDRLTFRVQ